MARIDFVYKGLFLFPPFEPPKGAGGVMESPTAEGGDQRHLQQISPVTTQGIRRALSPLQTT